MILISSCATVQPQRPKVLMCVIDHPRGEVICGDGQGETPIVKRAALKDLDRGVCFAPSDWFEIQNYIDRLEANQR
jgi:hypothetical protein